MHRTLPTQHSTCPGYMSGKDQLGSLDNVIAIQSVPLLLAYPTLLLSSNLILEQNDLSWAHLLCHVAVPVFLGSILTIIYKQMGQARACTEMAVTLAVLFGCAQSLGSIRTVVLSLVLVINKSVPYFAVSLAFDAFALYRRGFLTNAVQPTLLVVSYVALSYVHANLRNFDNLKEGSFLPPLIATVSSTAVLAYNYDQLHLSMIIVTIACGVVLQITRVDNKGVAFRQGSPTIVGFISILLEILSFKTNFIDDKTQALCEVALVLASAFVTVDESLFQDVLKKTVSEASILTQLFQHDDTKAIFSYLMLNTMFMFVQFLYSFRSKSLGLLSDSLHMALDCTSLALGLVAGVLAKRPPNESFPFGLTRIETLAGFANGVLLVGIVAGIFIEAVERIINPITLERTGELLVVSFLGFVVNIIGIFAFNHGHEHGHSHGHSHSHGSEGDNENMKGIFLHILADTLGSAGVVVSTLLTSVFHTSIFDPIASLFIAVMIFISAIPLIKSSASNLLLSLGDKREDLMRDLLSQVSTTPGVVGYTTPRFFVSSNIKTCSYESTGVSQSVDHHDQGHSHSHSHDTGHLHRNSSADEDTTKECPNLVGYIHVQYMDGENSTIIKKRVQRIFENSNVHAVIQVESESSQCWCR